jgi:hypothetical protein
MYNRTYTIDPRSIAHCRACFEPMYYIYDQKLRSLCYECTAEHSLQQGLSYDHLIHGSGEVGIIV